MPFGGSGASSGCFFGVPGAPLGCLLGSLGDPWGTFGATLGGQRATIAHGPKTEQAQKKHPPFGTFLVPKWLPRVPKCGKKIGFGRLKIYI